MTERIRKISKKMLRSYRGLPDKKQYLEFFTAFLSIPMLVTVIMLNYNNLKTVNKTTASPTSTPEKVYITVPTSNANVTNSTSNQPAPTNTSCKRHLGPVQISSPTEGETVTDNPTSISIDYQMDTYCAAVWAYRINGGSWSDYDDKSIALYNLPQGNIKLDLRVKSIASGEEKDLTRNFIYKGQTGLFTPTPSITSDNTSSASAG